MGGNWNDTTDRKLLLTIIHLTGAQVPKWDQVAELMGDGFTSEAVRQHFAKLRKNCDKEFSDSNGTPKAKSTPRKPASKTTNGETPTKSTGKRKGRTLDADVDDDEESPSKKTNIKTEKTEENVDGLDLI